MFNRADEKRIRRQERKNKSKSGVFPLIPKTIAGNTKSVLGTPTSSKQPMITQRELEYTIGLVGNQLIERKMTLSCAESCTGGLAASLLTDMSGSSRWFVGAVVAYANEVKSGVLGVAESTLIAHGAVSSETVLGMAYGVRRVMNSDASFSLSGIAGPTGGTPEKPVGTVWIGWNILGHQSSDVYHLTGDRQYIKFQSAALAITRLAELLESMI